MTEADGLWSFAGSSAGVSWVRAALDAESRRVVAMAAGDRSAFTAHCLWDLLPAEYRGGAVFRTDSHPSYRAVVPGDRHAAAGKEEGLTNHVERSWPAARQLRTPGPQDAVVLDVSAEPHPALWYFVRLDNESRE